MTKKELLYRYLSEHGVPSNLSQFARDKTKEFKMSKSHIRKVVKEFRRHLQSQAQHTARDLVKQYMLSNTKVKDLVPDVKKIAKYIKIDSDTSFSESSILQYVNEFLSSLDMEIIRQNVHNDRQLQKYKDQTRIKNKSSREYYRVQNAIVEYSEAIIKELELMKRSDFNYTFPDINTKVAPDDEMMGVIQLSDIHANELINLPHNKYDFTVFSRRLFKLATVAFSWFMGLGVKKVLVVNTGDILNSDRRLDEMLSQATNRAKATLLTVHILRQMLVSLRQSFDVQVISVMGNESRIKDEVALSDIAISDNYDFTVFAILKELLGDKIKFLSIDKAEQVVNICGHKVLFTHDVARKTSKQEASQSIVGRYSLINNPVDFIIAGHVHDPRVTSVSSRGGSMSGSNSYNEVQLNLAGRASQNLYVFGKKDRMAMTVDLQHPGKEGYEVIKRLESYNAKSASKSQEKTTIIEIKI